MYKCDVCGREINHRNKTHGYSLCTKHYRQFKKYGEFKDNNPRTYLDRNEYHIDGDITYIDLYNKNYEVTGQAIIDTEDLDKVKYTKWKLTASGYVANTPKYKGSNKHLSREILGVDAFVDHINHNTLDNRKVNLRVVTKSQNQMNSNHKGVTHTDNGKYYAHIKINQKMVNLGVYMYEEEAYYARWVAEEILFGEYRYPKEKPVLSKDRERQIKEYVIKKAQRL